MGRMKQAEMISVWKLLDFSVAQAESADDMFRANCVKQRSIAVSRLTSVTVKLREGALKSIITRWRRLSSLEISMGGATNMQFKLYQALELGSDFDFSLWRSEMDLAKRMRHYTNIERRLNPNPNRNWEELPT